MKILLLNGPNLNLLGQRPAHYYGACTWQELEQQLKQRAEHHGVTLNCKQSNHEGQLLDWMHESLEDDTKGLILNAGAYTHTSIALSDALEVLTYPIIEVHLSNIYAREAFRHHSYMAPHVTGQISGLGPQGYLLALDALVSRLQSIK